MVVLRQLRTMQWLPDTSLASLLHLTTLTQTDHYLPATLLTAASNCIEHLSEIAVCTNEKAQETASAGFSSGAGSRLFAGKLCRDSRLRLSESLIANGSLDFNTW